MKKLKSVVSALLFAVVYPFACVSAPYDSRVKDVLWGYFINRSLPFMLIRIIVLFLLVYLITYLNRTNIRFLSVFIPVFMFFLTLLSVYDRFYSLVFFYNYYIILFFGVAVGAANAAVFLCATLHFKEGYFTFYRSFWFAMTGMYLFLLYICFVRTPDAYELSINMHLGQGTIKYFRYVFQHPEDTYVGLICFGNIFIFTPLPFVLKNLFPKVPNALLPLLGICFPIGAEAYQYVFRCGNVDIDDLLLNAIGITFGFLLLLLLQKKKLPNNKSAVLE